MKYRSGTKRFKQAMNHHGVHTGRVKNPKMPLWSPPVGWESSAGLFPAVPDAGLLAMSAMASMRRRMGGSK